MDELAREGYIALVHTQKGIFVLAVKVGESWAIQGFKEEREALDYFEKSYGRGHRRGYEGSMSASLNWISFQPSICYISINNLKPLIADMHVTHVRNIAGWIDGILLKKEAMVLWENGVKPTLINEEMFKQKEEKCG